MTLTHELGHLVLHSNYAFADAEEQGDEFAAEFLMPAHAITADLTALKPAKVLALKAVWGVSMPALFEQAVQLDKASQVERQRFRKTLNSRGWTTHEPGTERIPEERPELAASIGAALIAQGLTHDEVSRMTGCTRVPDDDPFVPAERPLRLV